MFKKTVTYTDYNGDERTEDFYFNLNKVELIELEFLSNGQALSDYIQEIIRAKDMSTVVKLIKQILLTSYGVKTPDGKRFIKNDEVVSAFEQSPAYETIYWELATDAEKAASFFSAIVPASVRENIGDNPKQELLDKMRALEENKQ